MEFKWDDAYSVGNNEIDAQHKKLLELADMIPESMSEPLVKNYIMALCKYTREHFTVEEQMMQDMGYPKLEDHRQLHDGMIFSLRELSTKPFTDAKSVGEFKKFVYEWVIDHILRHDKEFIEFVQKTA